MTHELSVYWPLALVACVITSSGDVRADEAGAKNRDAQVELLKQLELNHGCLEIQAGEYLFTESLDIDLRKFHSVVVRAAGPVTIRMQGTGPAIRLTGSLTGSADPKQINEATWRESMPRIEGIKIVGEHPEASGMEFVQTLQPTISSVSVRHCKHGLIFTQRNRNVVISNVHLYDNSGIGLFLDHCDLHQFNVANSHISYNRSGGIVVRGGNVRNIHVTGCDIEANMPGDATPTDTANVFIDCRHSGTIAEVAITGNTIQHSAHYAAEKQAPGGANIRVQGRDDFHPNMITVTGNVMSDTHTHVHLSKCSDTALTGNTFFTTEPTDLQIEDCQRIVVANCSLNPREAYGTGQVVLARCQHCVVQGLTCHELLAGPAAIQLIECHSCRVTGCIISGSRNGVVLNSGNSCSVADCTVSDLPSSGQAVIDNGNDHNVSGMLSSYQDQTPIVDSLRGAIGNRWRVDNENHAAWRSTERGLEIMIEPGNLWGASNDAKNIFVTPLPSGWYRNCAARVTVQHAPQKRWEQANLAWYASASRMVKLGLELENGATNIVMGREENDRTRTIAIVPYAGEAVQLQLSVSGNVIVGQFRQPGADAWIEAGKTDLPADSSVATAGFSLHCYQGAEGSNRWVAFSDFELSRH